MTLLPALSIFRQCWRFLCRSTICKRFGPNRTSRAARPAQNDHRPHSRNGAGLHQRHSGVVSISPAARSIPATPSASMSHSTIRRVVLFRRGIYDYSTKLVEQSTALHGFRSGSLESRWSAAHGSLRPRPCQTRRRRRRRKCCPSSGRPQFYSRSIWQALSLPGHTCGPHGHHAQTLRLALPKAESREALTVIFDREMDDALLRDQLEVEDAQGRPQPGQMTASASGRPGFGVRSTAGVAAPMTRCR